ncbi:MAG: polysulfide reductase NrfD [Candidatus Marinimicrobia bacterium]|nr:polysulfide reductase NrfD [Candidatus Neomarinimicrobiota bacterium]
MPFGSYFRSLLIPFNIFAFLILCVGIPITWIRFSQGLGAVTNLSDNNPWGLWIGFDVLCGVALAAGGFIIAAVVHIFKLKDYYPIVRPAILTGFLGYFFVVVGLLFDLGHPLRLPFPVFVTYGVTSVMFLVAWHVFLYLTIQFIEFSPVIFEWLGWNKARRLALKLTIGATVLGVILSTLHQSALGALFLLAPGKLHPLWYSTYIPVFFFISAIAAGISMVIFESTFSHRIFHSQIDEKDQKGFNKLILGLGKAGAIVMFTYFCLKLLGIAHSNNWYLLGTSYGQWFLLEVLGFVLGPCLLYVYGVRNLNPTAVKIAAVWSILGIILNRVNVSMVAFNWKMAERYFPSWMELVVTITIITLGLLTFRWVVNRMPVLYVHPDYPRED